MSKKPESSPVIADLNVAHPFILPFIYLITTIPIVLFLSFFRQPIGVADEWSHIARAAQIADGRIFTEVAETGKIPQGIIDPNFKILTDAVHQRRHEILATAMPDFRTFRWTDERVLANYNSSVYFPAPYLVSVAAIHYGRIAGLSIVETLQISNILNGIVCITLVALAILISPSGKLILFILAALPMTLYSFASSSPDGPLISSAMLLFAFLTRSLEWRTTSVLTLTAAAVLAIVIAGTKLPYLPLVGAAVFTIWFSASTQRPRGWILVLVLFIVATVPIAWVKMSNAGGVDASWGAGVSNPSGQIAFLLHNPLMGFVVAAATIKAFGWLYLQQLVGYLGWLDAPISAVGQKVLLAMAAGIFFLDAPVKRFTIAHGILAGGLLLSVGAVFLSLYIAYNPVGSIEGIIGVQGRYFLPVLPFFAFLIPCRSWRPWRFRTAFAIVCVAVLISHFEILRTVIERYYL